ncbi:hypothetical protein AK812_SmicGene35553 [Symbiodinium microadriaticum]|uniref:Potassium channel tetramerisation-type BTB domain-containing protein n=1 Tax=Symbiodinium microadriaticum TaxID=2951 RepID=A0A1Q9CL68_SYMMI|nr:hypothetical protein AK812_SmicGene35553 [Symbiodinium microadriaticum]
MASLTCCSAGLMYFASVKRCHARLARKQVTLNVGGSIFTCERSTLEKCDFLAQVLRSDPASSEVFLDRFLSFNCAEQTPLH